MTPAKGKFLLFNNQLKCPIVKNVQKLCEYFIALSATLHWRPTHENAEHEAKDEVQVNAAGGHNSKDKLNIFVASHSGDARLIGFNREMELIKGGTLLAEVCDGAFYEFLVHQAAKLVSQAFNATEVIGRARSNTSVVPKCWLQFFVNECNG